MVELMVSTTLAGFLMLAVITAFLFMGRSGANLQNYTEMETQARRAIETFAEDVRMAKNATWNSADSVTLSVVTALGTSKSYTYTYDSSAGTFTRSDGTTSRKLISGIVAGTFTYSAYKINTSAIDLSDSSTLATASTLTKQIQISLRTIRSKNTVTDATNAVISARFILRNKNVTA
jgi:Tfp pilus assembly protein PilW